MARNKTFTPEARKRVIARRAKIKRALIDLKTRRTGLAADLQNARARESRFKVSVSKADTLLKQHQANLADVKEALRRLELSTSGIRGNIDAKKVKAPQKTSLAQHAVLARSQKEIPKLRREVKRLQTEVSRAKTTLQMSNENLSATQRDIKSIFKAGDRVNTQIRKLS